MSRLIAIGDIHGCYEQLRAVIEDKIKARRDDKIVFLGDYIDRGPEIRKTIDYILGLKEDGFNIVPLRGNHEIMMLHAISTGEFSIWFWNGGESTHESLGIYQNGTLDARYMRFFEDLLWYHQEGNYLFVHAGFSDNNPFSDRNAMLWTRNEVYTNPVLTDKIIVHGHTPITVDQCIDRASGNNHVINIDTGCVYDDPGYRTLTAIELTPSEKLLWQVCR